MPDSIEFSPLENVLPSFITPVGRFRLPDHEPIDGALSSAVETRARRSRRKTGKAGWNSNEDILNWPEAGISDLARYVRKALEHMILLVRDGEEYAGSVKVNAWARLHEPGASWPVSHHPRAHWTCLYFSETQLSEEATGAFRSPLVLHDPRGVAINMMPHPGATGLNGSIMLRPEPGMLLIFPAWLAYSVNILEPGERMIVVGFAATLTVPGESESPIALA